jgi:hypothetical protein
MFKPTFPNSSSACDSATILERMRTRCSYPLWLVSGVVRSATPVEPLEAATLKEPHLPSGVSGSRAVRADARRQAPLLDIFTYSRPSGIPTIR